MKNRHFNELTANIHESINITGIATKASQLNQCFEPDVKAIRENIGFSQSKFADLIGVNLRTIQNWEQGHRSTTGPAKVLLRLVQVDHKLIVNSLHANHV